MMNQRDQVLFVGDLFLIKLLNLILLDSKRQIVRYNLKIYKSNILMTNLIINDNIIIYTVYLYGM